MDININDQCKWQFLKGGSPVGWDNFPKDAGPT